MLLVRTTIEALSRRSVLVGCVALVVLASSHAQAHGISEALRARGLTDELRLGVGDNLETEPANAIQSWCKIRL